MSPVTPTSPGSTGRGRVAALHRREAANLPALTPHRFRLLFPTSWEPPFPEGNRYSPLLENLTLEWLQRFGLATTEREVEVVRQFDCGRYGGYSSPCSSFRDVLLITQFISLWLFWDDEMVEQGIGWSIQDFVTAMEGAPSRDENGFAQAWRDLSERLRRTQSGRWMRRLLADMEDWMRLAKVDTSSGQGLLAEGVMPRFEEMLAIRTVNIGMYPTFHLLEMAEGFELPDHVFEDEDVRELKRLSSRLVAFGNELGGLGKDVANGWPNLALALQHERDMTIEDAVAAVVEMHNADVESFDDVAARLRSWEPTIDLQAREWVQAIRYSVVGFTRWEAGAERYQRHKLVVDGRVLAAPVVFFAG